MADIRSKVYEIYSLEQLSSGNSCIHALHPLVKMGSTFVFMICILSFDRYALSPLVPFVFYPVIVMSLAEIPYRMILKRALIALPFSLFAGLSNVFFDNKVAITYGSVSISFGWVSFLAIMLRTMLCICAVLILVAVTPFSELTAQLRRLCVPDMLVSLFEMTYRYIGTLLGEASSMFTAYSLRSRSKKGLEMKHMGSFVGQLLIRSFDRAERVYNAMKCRGYPASARFAMRKKLTGADLVFFLCVALPSVFLRIVDIFGLFSMWLGGLA